MVDDTLAPNITCPPAVTVNTGASLDPANTGTATAADIEMLIETVRDRVEAAQGVRLVPEVRIIGEGK